MFKIQTVLKVVKILSIFFVVLGLTGCVKTTQNIVVTKEGKMHVEVITDSTELNETQKAEGNYKEKTEKEICKTLSIKRDWGLETEECEVSLDKNIASVKGIKSLTADSFLEQNGYIRFYIEDLLNEPEDTTFHVEAEDIDMLRSEGVETHMNIEMPDDIVVASRGEISGNIVSIDMISVLANKEEGETGIVVISKSSSAVGEIPWDTESLLVTKEEGQKNEIIEEERVENKGGKTGKDPGTASTEKRQSSLNWEFPYIDLYLDMDKGIVLRKINFF